MRLEVRAGRRAFGMGRPEKEQRCQTRLWGGKRTTAAAQAVTRSLWEWGDANHGCAEQERCVKTAMLASPIAYASVQYPCYQFSQFFRKFWKVGEDAHRVSEAM